MLLTAFASIAFAAIGIILVYCFLGDMFGFVDLDKVFRTRRGLFFTLFPLVVIECALWVHLFP